MRKNPWLRAGFDLWSLGFEASSVMALRSLKLSVGDSSAEKESQRMIQEKIDAALALQTLLLTGGLGMTMPGALTKTVAHYRRKVRANRRRLAKD